MEIGQLSFAFRQVLNILVESFFWIVFEFYPGAASRSPKIQNFTFLLEAHFSMQIGHLSSSFHEVFKILLESGL